MSLGERIGLARQVVLSLLEDGAVQVWVADWRGGPSTGRALTSVEMDRLWADDAPWTDPADPPAAPAASDDRARHLSSGTMVGVPSGLDGNPDPISTPRRDRVLGRVADEVVQRRVAPSPLLVGIDGIDGSGKTTFADEVAAVLTERGQSVVRASIDSFHNPRAVRWRRGVASPVGFYLDSHDLEAVRRELLDPFRAGQGAMYRTAAFDEPTDQPVDALLRTVAGDEVLLFDGIFLCRPELIDCWDLTVFLDGHDRVSLTRLGYVLADAPEGGTDLVAHVLRWAERIDRYTSGMRIYLDSEDPRSRVDLVIDNNDLESPSILEGAE